MAHQALPWPDQPLTYYKKYRVYFQDYAPGHHKQISRIDWGIGAGSGAKTPAAANGGDEYDVPQCVENMAKVRIKCSEC